MIHQQVNRRNVVHLHQRAKPEKGTERERNEMVNDFWGVHEWTKKWMNLKRGTAERKIGLMRELTDFINKERELHNHK